MVKVDYMYKSKLLSIIHKIYNNKIKKLKNVKILILYNIYLVLYIYIVVHSNIYIIYESYINIYMWPHILYIDGYLRYYYM